MAQVWRLLLLQLIVCVLHQATVVTSNKNVLFLMADDLRVDIKAYADRGVRTNDVTTDFVTPNLDQLADQSLVMLNAYCNYPLCGPSRASIMTGRYPDTIRSVSLSDDFRHNTGKLDLVTLPGFFKSRGYATHGRGKIFHLDDTEANYGLRSHRQSAEMERCNCWYAATPAELATDPLTDQHIRDEALDLLDQLKENITDGVINNFFLAVGFKKPHLPWIFPDTYLNTYSLNQIDLPSSAERQVPVNFPEIARDQCGELCDKDDIQMCGNLTQELMPNRQLKELRRAYYSSVTFIDALIGDVLTRLDDLNLTDDTVVFFMSDHGWSLGEHNHYCKKTLFQESLQIPMMLKVPGMTDLTANGISTSKPVEALDAYPTIVEAAMPGVSLTACDPSDPISLDECGEGTSLMPLINDPDLRSWKKWIFSQVSRSGSGITGASGDQMGYSAFDGRYRYNVYAEYDASSTYKPTLKKAVKYDNLGLSELYDLKSNKDPWQVTNEILPNLPEVSRLEKKERKLFKKIKNQFS